MKENGKFGRVMDKSRQINWVPVPKNSELRHEIETRNTPAAVHLTLYLMSRCLWRKNVLREVVIRLGSE
jgi:hypothetical protein